MATTSIGTVHDLYAAPQQEGDTILLLQFSPTSIIMMRNHTCTRYARSTHPTTSTTAKPTTSNGVVVGWDDVTPLIPTLQFCSMQSGLDEDNEQIAVMFRTNTDDYRFTSDCSRFTIYDGDARHTQLGFACNSTTARQLTDFFQAKCSAYKGVQFALETNL
jgi:hypothetical protein